MSERQGQSNLHLKAMKNGTNDEKENSHSDRKVQVKKEDLDSSRGENPREPSERKLQSPQVQEEDECVKTKDTRADSRVRYNTTQKKKAKRLCDNHVHVSMYSDRKQLESEVGENAQDGALNWFKITIPWGKKYDKEWLMNSLQSHCSASFTPVDFHYSKYQARFFIQDSNIASELKEATYKICDERNQKICIFVSESVAPYSVQKKLNAEEMYELEMTMIKRYDDTLKTLDLHTLRFDPDLVAHGIDIVLNRRNYMAAVLQIIEKNFPMLLSLNLCNNKLYQLDGLSDIVPKVPRIKVLDISNNELSSTWEVNKIKGLNLEELWLEGNPLYYTFSDHSNYVSAIQSCFPTLRCLDGQQLTLPSVAKISPLDIVKPLKLQKTSKDPEMMRNLIRRFLKQYFSVYDNEDRQRLLDTYHEESCFSLSIPSNPEDPALNSLCELYKENRNMKKLQDSYLRLQLLKHTKYDIVRSLSALPKTQHDLDSFVVDLLIQTDAMLCFSVHGLFREVEGKSQGSFRTFVRTFITIPVCCSNEYIEVKLAEVAHVVNSICRHGPFDDLEIAVKASGKETDLRIVNDELCVSVVTTSKSKCFPSNQIPTLMSNFKHGLSPKQQEMVHTFAMQSGMTFQWSQKCLQENDWNYAKATHAFTMLKVGMKCVVDMNAPGP